MSLRFTDPYKAMDFVNKTNKDLEKGTVTCFHRGVALPHYDVSASTDDGQWTRLCLVNADGLTTDGGLDTTREDNGFAAAKEIAVVQCYWPAGALKDENIKPTFKEVTEVRST